MFVSHGLGQEIIHEDIPEHGFVGKDG
jgi:hypothetical protein